MGHRKPKVSPSSKGTPRGKKSNQHRKDQPQSTPTARYLNKNLFFIGLLAGALVPCFPYIWQYVNLFNSKSFIPTFNSAENSISDVQTPILPEYERVSLFEPYSVDYNEILRVREENMEKYPYEYNKYGIDRRSGLSLQEFWDVYDGKWPVIVTDVVPTWEAANWTRDFFNEHYGKERVTMKAVDHLADSAISAVLPDYLHFSPDLLDDLGIYSQKGLESAVSLALPLELFYKNTHDAYPTRWTYIEDELFIPMRPHLKEDIGECKFLNEDYFKLFPPEVRPWDAMLLWGTKYSRSSLHIDPYNWTGTNAVFRGRKRWKMYPPGQDHSLDVIKGRKSGFPLDCYKYNSPVDSYEPDFNKHPKFSTATAIEFDQLPGEMLIIPTGWFHQAFNVEETMAISSQVMNTNNVRIVLEEVLKVGNVQRNKLPRDIDQMSPADQVKTVMSMLSDSILKRGREVTKDALDQISGEKVLVDGRVTKK